MSVENIKRAYQTFEKIKQSLEKRKLKYREHTEKFGVVLTFEGDDMTFDLSITVLPENKLVCLHSQLPIVIDNQKTVEIALATNMANCNLAFGSFDFDSDAGILQFRCSATYEECLLGDGFIYHLVDNACFAVDKFNDKFLNLNLGYMTLDDFFAEIG